MTDRRLLTVKQIAAELGCSEKTIRRMFKAGELPGAFKLRGRSSPIKVPAESILKLRESGG